VIINSTFNLSCSCFEHMSGGYKSLLQEPHLSF